MPTKYRDYPIYRYDEPAVYQNFSGGINTDPSNDHLLESELRDSVNMTYLSGALVKRKGAKKICDISCEDDLETIQGIFLFTYRVTYLILAADGKLYQGIYNEGTTIKLSRLYIYKPNQITGFVHDEEDPFAGLEEKSPSQLVGVYKHEGFTQTFFRDTTTGKTFAKNPRGSYYDVSGGSINIGDVFEETDSLIAQRYLCIKAFQKTNDYPEDSPKWDKYTAESEDGTVYTYTDGQGNSITLDSSTLTDADMEAAAEYRVYEFNISDIKQWRTGDVALRNGVFYVCNEAHYNRYGSLRDDSLFVNLEQIASTIFEEDSFMIFQNHRKVGFATLNNKLYIATGTRIVEVYLDTDELRAKPIDPYLCNYTEVEKIGYNRLSPYPELAVASQKDTVTTDVSAIKVKKTVGGKYLLTPVMNIQIGDSAENYYYRWEKNINGIWYVVVPFHSQEGLMANPSGGTSEIGVRAQTSLEVDDANVYQYRVTMARAFEETKEVVEEWSNASDYHIGDYVSVGAKVYRCLRDHEARLSRYDTGEFQLSAYLGTETEEEGETVIVWDDRPTLLWQEIHEIEMLPYIYRTLDQNGQVVENVSYIYDYVINKTTGEYFGSAASVPYNDNLSVSDDFIRIHSCTAVLTDGQKLIFYKDRYNSGEWFKTIINNPSYIVDRGCLSFKTNKNEAIVGIVPFQGNIIVFANSEEAGGSIHLVQGNGDDYNDESGYYSPYQRRTINSVVSCDNPDTIQVCDNILVFKYFNRVYYINASELSNDVVKVNSCNDRLLEPNQEVRIPWDDNDVVSEATDTYYALIWKEKYMVDEAGDLVLEHPGMRVKMYYKMSVQHADGSYGMPWLRDESDVFNARHILYAKGRPIYLFHNILCSFSEECYNDLGTEYECKIHLRAEGLNYPSQWKLIDKVVIGHHRNQFKKVDLSVIIRNEAGHKLIDTDSKRFSVNDLGVLFAGAKNDGQSMRLGSTIRDDRTITATNMFPCLLADATITAKTEGAFTLSSITYSYESTEMPDQNAYDVYQSIIRPKEVK